MARRPPPSRYDLFYIVSCWGCPVDLEHQVLSAVIASFGSYDKLPPDLFGPVGGSMYDEVTLRDAWGTPIVFMPAMHPAIGMALGNRPFFVSAGPDRMFRTLEDNLYSYEQGAPEVTE